MSGLVSVWSWGLRCSGVEAVPLFRAIPKSLLLACTLAPPQTTVITSPGGGAWVGDRRCPIIPPIPNLLSLLALLPLRNLSSSPVGSTQHRWRGLGGCWRDTFAGSCLHLLPPPYISRSQNKQGGLCSAGKGRFPKNTWPGCGGNKPSEGDLETPGLPWGMGVCSHRGPFDAT